LIWLNLEIFSMLNILIKNYLSLAQNKLYRYGQASNLGYGGSSSVGRAPVCGSGGRRFNPGLSPHPNLSI
jgi:hypothetical protein